MSLYLGKDSGGINSILHITSSSYSEAVLKSGIQPNTIFHTGISYPVAEIFELTNVQSYSNSYHSGIVGTLPTLAITSISSRFISNNIPICFIAVDGKLMHNHCMNYNMRSFIWDYMDTNSFPSSIYVGHSSIVPSNLYKYKALGGITGSSISIILTSLSYNTVSGNIVNTSTLFNISSNISISASDIIVNGTSLKNTKFISLKDVSASKTFIGNSSGDVLSVLNSVPPSSVKLSVTPSRIYMQNSYNEFIFDTSIGKLSILNFGNIFYTELSSTSTTATWYTNINITSGNAIVLCSYNSVGTSAVWSTFYVASTIFTDMYSAVTSASGTTVAFSAAISIVSGNYKLVIKRTLIRLGSDGNMGSAGLPEFSKYLLLK